MVPFIFRYAKNVGPGVLILVCLAGPAWPAVGWRVSGERLSRQGPPIADKSGGAG